MNILNDSGSVVTVYVFRHCQYNYHAQGAYCMPEDYHKSSCCIENIFNPLYTIITVEQKIFSA